MENPIKGSILKKYPGNVRQWFGENPQWYPQFGGHPGIDIATHEGDLVVAAHDGVVVQVKNDPAGYGRSVWLFSESQGFLSVYGHLGNIAVLDLEAVKAGDLLGTESNSGFVISGNTMYWGDAPAGKGVHLHFGLMANVRKGAYPGGQIGFNTGINLSFPMGQGLKGWVDPMPYLKEMQAKLLQEKNQKELYIEINGKPYYVGDYGIIEDFKAMGWLSEEKEQRDSIDLGRIIK